MKRRTLRPVLVPAATLAVSALFAFVAKTAQAQLKPAFTLERASAAAGIRFGTNDLNAGVGALIGYTLPQSIYLGADFDYWFGQSQDNSGFGAVYSVKSHAWNVFGVVGYDFGVLPALVLRPELGVGVVHGDAEVCQSFPFSPVVQCASTSASNAAGLFGGQLMYLLGSSFHVGGELRIIVADNSAVVFAGNVGLVF
jgi:hypothetical protein